MVVYRDLISSFKNLKKLYILSEDDKKKYNILKLFIEIFH